MQRYVLGWVFFTLLLTISLISISWKDGSDVAQAPFKILTIENLMLFNDETLTLSFPETLELENVIIERLDDDPITINLNGGKAPAIYNDKGRRLKIPLNSDKGSTKIVNSISISVSGTQKRYKIEKLEFFTKKEFDFQKTNQGNDIEFLIVKGLKLWDEWNLIGDDKVVETKFSFDYFDEELEPESFVTELHPSSFDECISTEIDVQKTKGEVIISRNFMPKNKGERACPLAPFSIFRKFEFVEKEKEESVPDDKICELQSTQVTIIKQDITPTGIDYLSIILENESEKVDESNYQLRLLDSDRNVVFSTLYCRKGPLLVVKGQDFKYPSLGTHLLELYLEANKMCLKQIPIHIEPPADPQFAITIESIRSPCCKDEKNGSVAFSVLRDNKPVTDARVNLRSSIKGIIRRDISPGWNKVPADNEATYSLELEKNHTIRSQEFTIKEEKEIACEYIFAFSDTLSLNPDNIIEASNTSNRDTLFLDKKLFLETIDARRRNGCLPKNIKKYDLVVAIHRLDKLKPFPKGLEYRFLIGDSSNWLDNSPSQRKISYEEVKATRELGEAIGLIELKNAYDHSELDVVVEFRIIESVNK